jgi:putative membrane protein
VSEEEIPHATRGTEYLANERTFLAWIRTSIAIVSLGFVVARFSLWLREMSEQMGRPPVRAHGVSLPMGELLMVFGGVMAALAAWRYHIVNRQIEENRVRADRALVLLVTASVAVLALAMAAAMILTAGRS